MARARALDLRHDPVPKVLFGLWAPTVIGLCLTLVVGVTDAFFIGLTGPEPLASVGLALAFVTILANILMGLSIGVTTVVAGLVGRGGTDMHAVGAQALGLGLACAFVLMCAMGPFTASWLALLGTPPSLMQNAQIFLEIWVAGLPVVAAVIFGTATLRAVGAARAAALVMLAVAVINGACSPFLILGIGPFPALGVPGAALTTISSYAIGGALALRSMRAAAVLNARVLGFDLECWRRMLAVGLPAMIAQALAPLGMAAIMAIVTGFGTAAVTALSAGIQIEKLMMVFVLALGAAVNPFVGQNWNAGQFERVREGLHRARRAIFVWGISTWCVLALLAQPIASLFTTDPQAIDYLASFLRTSPLGYAFAGIVSVAGGALNGIGRPLLAAGLSLLRVLVLSVPAAYLASRLYGPAGAFGGMAVGSLGAALMSLRWTALPRPAVLPTNAGANVAPS